jgi:putative N-acetylmannosamine-6-phosphate epimerase
MHNTEQKVLITPFQHEVNEMFEKGWKVTSVTANHHNGKFCFILEKQKNGN